MSRYLVTFVVEDECREYAAAKVATAMLISFPNDQWEFMEAKPEKPAKKKRKTKK